MVSPSPGIRLLDGLDLRQGEVARPLGSARRAQALAR
jgi:hypothetical protein